MNLSKSDIRKIVRKNSGKGGIQESNDWLLTYADAVTLLLTFLVLLLSVSTVDQAKYETFSESIKGELSEAEPGKFQVLKEEIEQSIISNNFTEQVEVEDKPKGIKISFGSNDFFKSGQADLLPASKVILKEVVDKINQFANETNAFVVEVEGHTDDVPIENIRFPSNWELSASRATNVVKYFIESGIDKKHLKASGFGDIFPIVPNRDVNGIGIPENRAKNRRIEILILRQTPEVRGMVAEKDSM